MRKMLLLVNVIVVLMVTQVASQSYSYLFQNRSEYTIWELYFSRVEDGWGRDHLGGSVLGPGRDWRLSGIGYGRWDLKLVDEDGDICTVGGILMDRNRTLTITSAWLLACEGYSEEREIV